MWQIFVMYDLAPTQTSLFLFSIEHCSLHPNQDPQKKVDIKPFTMHHLTANTRKVNQTERTVFSKDTQAAYNLNPQTNCVYQIQVNRRPTLLPSDVIWFPFFHQDANSSHL